MNETTGVVAPPAAQDAVGGMTSRAFELFEAGGPVTILLVVMSVAVVAIVVAKLMQFRAARLGDGRLARHVLAAWLSGDARTALRLVEGARNPAVLALGRAIRGRRRGLPDAVVREEVLRYGGDALEALRSWFRPLEVIATLAPLLGLFGTVLGMIEAFRRLEQAGNHVNPAILSGGIWEALLTTAVGLAVAIPAVVSLNWLERRVDRLAHEMDNLVTRVFTEDLSGDSFAEEYDHADARVQDADAPGE